MTGLIYLYGGPPTPAGGGAACEEGARDGAEGEEEEGEEEGAGETRPESGSEAEAAAAPTAAPRVRLVCAHERQAPPIQRALPLQGSTGVAGRLLRVGLASRAR